MSLLTIVRVALKALGRNKLRTALTMLGMIIGVAAVVTMVGLGRGAQEEIEAQIRRAGPNLIRVRAGNFRRGGISQGIGGAPTLTVADADAIRAQVPGVLHLSAAVNTREQVIAANRNWPTLIEGSDVELPPIRSWDVQHGAFFDAAQVRAAARVAVLGSVVRDNLFGPEADPVGERIRIRNQSFRIVGVMAAKGAGAFGQDQDDVIFVPYTTVQKKLRGRDGTNISGIFVSAHSPDSVDRVAGEIAAVLRARHELAPGEPDDFMVRSQTDVTAMRSQMTRTMTGLLASIAGVSLIVGGIGIMNIMLVSVTERTREIGLRMAVGAQGRDVLRQFLVEAAVLSLVGGLAGAALGFGVSAALTRLLAWPTAIPAEAVAAAVAFAGAIGIAFGFYPARRAARLDPIEALRFE